MSRKSTRPVPEDIAPQNGPEQYDALAMPISSACHRRRAEAIAYEITGSSISLSTLFAREASSLSFHDRIDLNRCNSGDPLRDLPHPEEGVFFFLEGQLGRGMRVRDREATYTAWSAMMNVN